ncbi:hypothetical protein O9G_003557 [Rozella allomycis CSF55]|uniref:Uncharacterized protein n=1 Tax=Rozella allomycis (strain CSF55) TaxID=988480 RepID=A0A075B439_ROZAC|nr:hypothetical protein O9G_003557 [Rozella allomycis CSF55]|eukprot:EPZ35839.1 hypothetical protein O9G_003557 [Rozella allomycis CSF55]
MTSTADTPYFSSEEEKKSVLIFLEEQLQSKLELLNKHEVLLTDSLKLQMELELSKLPLHVREMRVDDFERESTDITKPVSQSLHSTPLPHEKNRTGKNTLRETLASAPIESQLEQIASHSDQKEAKEYLLELQAQLSSMLQTMK